MCISDWRIGRLIRSSTKTVLLGVAGTATIAANRQRVGIIIAVPFADPAAAVGVALRQGGVIIGSATTSVPQFMATLQTHGETPTLELSIQELTNNAVVVNITEYFMDESMLTAALESFKGEYPSSWR